MKRYSEPLRRLHPQGAATAKINGRRRRCYRGWFLRWYEKGTKKRGWVFAGEDVDTARETKKRLETAEGKGEGAITETLFDLAADEFLAWKRGELVPEAKAPEEKEGEKGKAWKREPTRHLQELHRKLDKLKESDSFHGRRLSEITARDLERYFTERKVGARTRNVERTILRGLFRWGRKHRFCAADPTEDLKKWREPRREARTLTREEEEALLDACRKEYKVEGIEGARNIASRKGGTSKKVKGKTWGQTFYPPAWLAPLVILALRTALRMGSLLRLEWRHVDLKKGEIHIPAEETKNQTDLTLPMHPDVLRLLDELKRIAKEKKEKVVSPRILASPTGGLPLPRTVARVFSGAVARAKLNPPITFHGLRKVAATRMLQGGADLKTVMAVGGWNDPGTLLRLYAQATEEAKRDAIAKL